MFRFNAKIGHVAFSAIAAILFSSTMIAAAVGPARAVETAPVALAQAEVGGAAYV